MSIPAVMPAQAPAAVAAGAPVLEHADPADGALAVHIEGGSLTATVDVSTLATQTTAAADAASDAAAKADLDTVAAAVVAGQVVVVDAGLAIIGAGNFTAGASTAAAPGMTGAGYLTLINTQPAGGLTMYIGTTPAAATSFPLPPGASRTARYANVTTVFVFGTGGTVGWIFER